MMHQSAAAAAALVLAVAMPGQPPTPQASERQDPERPQDPPATEPKTQLPPVVVTARKRTELRQDVPESLSVVGREQIRDGGLRTIKDAARYAPNTLMTEFSSRRLSFPFVRGIGSGQGDPAVATFIDGVPQLTVSSTNLSLLGVERIEFLRGPASALYGRNTIGGAINVVTQRPSDRFEFGSEITLGNYAYQDYRVSLSAPVAEDRLHFGFDALHNQRDGYTENDFTGNDVDSRDEWSGRGQLLWSADARNEFRLVVNGEVARDGGFVLSDLQGLRNRPNRINQDFEGDVDRDVLAAALTWNHSADRFDLTSITGAQDWSISESSDFDFSPLDGVRRFTDEEQTSITQEFRLSSPEDHDIALGEDAQLRWLVGVFGFYADSRREAANEFRPDGEGIIFPPGMVGTDRATGDFEDSAAAAFGQLTVTLHERWELAGALRYDYENKQANLRRVFEQGGFTVPISSLRQREDFDEVLPRGSLSYRWCDNVKTYVLAARGFKAGGFNLTAPSARVAFGPETSWTYEAGVKTTWLDDALEANVSVFHVDWDDMQLSQFDPSFGGYVTNAGEADSNGVEIELAAQPIEEIGLFGGLGFLDTEFDRFTDQFGRDVSGRNLPFAPDMTANAGGQLTLPLNGELTGYARAEYFHVGEFFYDAGNGAAERYDLANFRLGVAARQWRIEGWLNNAFDERYVPIALQINPADPTMFVGESAAPLTFGVTLRLTF